MRHRIKDIKVQLNGHWHGHYECANLSTFTASPDLFIISEAWERGCDFEEEADGFGEGLGTMDGDWSGIRDSKPAAINIMLAKALNFLFQPSTT